MAQNVKSHLPDSEIKIKIVKNGPYMVYGCPGIYQEFIIPDEYGASVAYKKGETRFDTDEPTCLCRCGKSDNKPYCDGTHVKVKWEGTETASQEFYGNNSRAYEGNNATLVDEKDLCAVARFCHHKDTNVWKLVKYGTTEEQKEAAIKKALMCPSGRLIIEDAKGENLEPPAKASVTLLEDPANDVSGPVWVQGGIPVIGSDGCEYERRNRATLCRCGHSSNKPFCDASHLKFGWKDDLF